MLKHLEAVVVPRSIQVFFCISWHGSCSVLLLRCSNNLVKPWSFVCFSILEEDAVVVGAWFLIFNRSMNISNGEVNSFQVFIVVLLVDPVLDELYSLRLEVCSDFEAFQLFRFENDEVFCSF